MSDKKETSQQHASPEVDRLSAELQYLRRHSEQLTVKMLALDAKAIGMRHELEQKRRGFSLIAELAVTLGKDSDYMSVFISVSRRINAALNMQRTAILMPDDDGLFRATVLRGYTPEEEVAISGKIIAVDAEMLDPMNPVVVTGADPADRLRSLREALALPFFISAPVIVHNEVAALLVTGRLVEQRPFLLRLGCYDVETVQMVSTYLAAMLTGQRLVEAEERTQIMLDAMPLCCNFWDEHCRNVDCNEEAARLFDLSGKQEYLEKFYELSPEFQPGGRLSSELAMEKVQEAFVKGRVRFEWMHQKLNGGQIPAEITLVRVRRGEGYIVAGYTRDLRELKAMLADIRKTEDALRLARDLAEKNARAKSEFLANMSHEIRTPMNAILGMTHLLGGTELSGKQRDYVEKAGHSAQLLLRIINDILDFSKIDTGRMEMKSITFSIRKLMANVRDVIREQARSKSLALLLTISEDVPDALVGDPLRLEQILINLAGNSVKFTPSGDVGLHVSRSADVAVSGHVQLLFEVWDSGIGMSKEQVAGLFTPFTQADTSITRKYGGTGLGLAISRSLVELMNGEIWCESEPGRGSAFYFTAMFSLPPEGGRHPGQQECGGQSLLSSDDTPVTLDPGCCEEDDFADLRGMRVLLAEDNEINQMIATELLEGKGVEVDVASTGKEALVALEGNKPYDVVLMDIQMPEMDGLTATAHIRDNPEHVHLPIIAMTAHAMVGDREVSLDGGMDDHLTKPIDPLLLYQALRRWGRCPRQ